MVSASLFGCQSGQLAPMGGPADAPETLVGRASVIDGDSVSIGAENVRFHGVDAPEATQMCEASGKRYPCGRVSADALDAFLAASRPLKCEFVERDRYQRFVGNCLRADGVSVSAWLVRNGHAVDFPEYSGGRYAAQEAEARTTKRGLWRGTFERPSDIRAANRVANSQIAAAASIGDVDASQCAIKGNISSRGERIFHVPGQRYYDATRISPSNGERYFCSEPEAYEAGWRKSRR